MLVPNELVPQQRKIDQCSNTQQHYCKQAEELERLHGVIQQKLDLQEVQKNGKRPRNAVIRFAVGTRINVNWLLSDSDTAQPGQHWDKPVQLAVKRQILHGIAAIGFEGGAKIMQRQSGEL